MDLVLRSQIHQVWEGYSTYAIEYNSTNRSDAIGLRIASLYLLCITIIDTFPLFRKAHCCLRHHHIVQGVRLQISTQDISCQVNIAVNFQQRNLSPIRVIPPRYPEEVPEYEHGCRETWWRNLAYVNNIQPLQDEDQHYTVKLI